MRALWAGTWRAMRVSWRYPDFWFAYTVWPLIFPAAYLLTAQALARGGQGFPAYPAYVVSGTLMWMWINTACWNVGGLLRGEQLGGTLEANWASPAPRWGLVVGPALGSIALSLLAMLAGAGAVTLIFRIRWSVPAPVAAAAVVASLPWVLGVGLCLAALVVWAKDVNALVNLVRGLFMVAGGITAPLAVLPGWLLPLARALPLTYALDAVRGGAAWAADLGHLLAFDVILCALGLFAFQRAEAAVRRAGKLGVY